MSEAPEAGSRPPRWDPDERGVGVADARAHLGRVDALRAAADEDGWVAEEPEAHLLPHIVRHIAEGAPFALQRATTDGDGTLEVVLRWAGPADAGRGTVRAAAYALIGVIAESTSLVTETSNDRAPQAFEVVTGMLAGQGRFAPHGHTLRLVVDHSTVPGTAAGVDA